MGLFLPPPHVAPTDAFFISHRRWLIHYAAGGLHYARQRILHDERKRGEILSPLVGRNNIGRGVSPCT